MVNAHQLGKIENGAWIYTEQVRATILKLVKQQLGVDLLEDAYPDQENRDCNALKQKDEKFNALAVSHDFVLVNSLNRLQINGEDFSISQLDALGVYINTTKVISIEHTTIVFVENLNVMANLSRLVFSSNSAYLENALWVYRGDIKPEQTTGKAYDFFRQFKHTHALMCFADFDPEGLKISLTSGATQLLAPDLNAFKLFKVNGADKEFYDQDTAKTFLKNRADLSNDILQLFENMKAHKRTIQQEHILAHEIPVSVYQIS